MSTDTLISLIARRKKEISFEIKALKEELKQLQKLEMEHSSEYENSESPPKTKRGDKSGPTLQEMIVEILQDRDNGATANEILVFIKEIFGKEVERTSLSPQLSRLKHSNKVSLDSGIWRLIHKKQDSKKLDS